MPERKMTKVYAFTIILFFVLFFIGCVYDKGTEENNLEKNVISTKTVSIIPSESPIILEKERSKEIIQVKSNLHYNESLNVTNIDNPKYYKNNKTYVQEFIKCELAESKSDRDRCYSKINLCEKMSPSKAKVYCFLARDSCSGIRDPELTHMCIELWKNANCEIKCDKHPYGVTGTMLCEHQCHRSPNSTPSPEEIRLDNFHIEIDYLENTIVSLEKTNTGGENPDCDTLNSKKNKITNQLDDLVALIQRNPYIKRSKIMIKYELTLFSMQERINEITCNKSN